MRRLIAAALATSFALPAAAHAQQPVADARLEGQFSMIGQITLARNVEGERVGQRFTRQWTFTPLCPTGPCSTINLVRNREGGTDELVLQNRGPGYYVGSGSFYAPLRCGRRTYSRGQQIRFSVSAQVTSTSAIGTELVATQILATYLNYTRLNRTPCFAVLGNDAASYAGVFANPTGGVGLHAESEAPRQQRRAR
jgi:hypothetical protein